MSLKHESHAFPALALLLVLIIGLADLPVTVHASFSDLTVDSMWLEDASQPGQPVTQVSPGQSFNIVATIKNIGQDTASGYYLDVYYDSDYGRGGPDSIAAGEAQVWYVGPLTAETGTHTTKWIANPDKQIAESNYDNNEMDLTFTVGSQTVNTTTITTSTSDSNSTTTSTTETTTTSSASSSTEQSTSTSSDTAPTCTITFHADPASGTVTADGVMEANDATEGYSSGQRVHVIAIPLGGYMFAGWEANGVSVENQLSQDTYVTVSNNGWLKADFASVVRSVAPVDLVVWRSSGGTWYVRHQDGSSWTQRWGTSGDVSLIGNVDGDGTGDLIIWRPSNGYWYVLESSKSYSPSQALRIQWGTSGDTPLVGDVDGDGRVDLIVWRPSNGYWYVLESSTGYDRSKAMRIQWGTSGDVPLVGRFDSDASADLIVWRQSTGAWYVLRSSTGYDRSKAFRVQWGTSGDKPLVGDVDGDGLSDLIVWRPSNGYWYALQSSKSYSSSQALRVQWGASTDEPLVGGYDSDGAVDLIVWRPSSGVWYVLKSSASYDRASASRVQWGTSGDSVLMIAPPDYLT